TIRMARVYKKPRPVLTVNNTTVDRRTISMHVEDRQKNADPARFVSQHFVFIQLDDVHHSAISSGNDYVWICGRRPFRITEKRDSAHKEQHKEPECPCRKQPENDRE